MAAEPIAHESRLWAPGIDHSTFNPLHRLPSVHVGFYI